MYVYKDTQGRYQAEQGPNTPMIEKAKRFTEAEKIDREQYEGGPHHDFVLFEDEIRASIVVMRDRSIALAKLLETV
ncbi:MAG: hypothetical protein EOO77_33030 [Oxalobacteraceae bacterium]|nr:MAG: hypothetical protein EOO77_33030 [Oxalobacteraceae bacterium]